MPGRLSGAGLSGGVCVGAGPRRHGARVRVVGARLQPRARARCHRRADGSGCRGSGAGRRPGRARSARAHGPEARSRARLTGEPARPGGDRDRRRVRLRRRPASARAGGTRDARTSAGAGCIADAHRPCGARRRCGDARGRDARTWRRRVSGRLVVVPTPIGNLEDVTLRALSALRDADVVACEDTRRTRVLLERFGVKAPLVSYHEHNEPARARELVKRMQGGDVVALVSDAGMPLVSDPGFVVLRDAIAAGVGVEVLPGPSAVLTALVASGLPSASWRFVGFLPRKKSELASVLASPETLVAFESPKRLGKSLAAVAPDREVAVCRELTKVHEEVVRGTAGSLAARYADAPPRGEIVLVVGPARDLGKGVSDDAVAAFDALVAAGAWRIPAVSVVARRTR